MLVSDAVAATLAGLGADTLFGVVGSGNFHLANALIARAPGSSRPGTRAAPPAWPTAGRGPRAGPACSPCTRDPG